jgi:hypothetical protein
MVPISWVICGTMPVEVKLILGAIPKSLRQKPEITGENTEKLGRRT